MNYGLIVLLIIEKRKKLLPNPFKWMDDEKKQFGW
jgi:thiol:disulfide interchange protein